MASKKVGAPPEKVVLYLHLLESVGGVDAKSNFGSAYTAVNGNMYKMIPSPPPKRSSPTWRSA